MKVVSASKERVAEQQASEVLETELSVASINSVNSSSESLSAHGRWNKLHGNTVKAIKFSQSFRTLRDMVGDIYIDNEHLKKGQKLGEGTFAFVEKCQYITNGGKTRDVAVKRLKREIFKSRGDLKDFIKEAKILKKLYHPNIVEIIGMGMELDDLSVDQPMEREKFYIVQEYMSQGTLMTKVVKQMKQSPKTIYTLQQGIQWLIHVAEGLAYLHNSNPRVIHRDLKLENIMLQKDRHGKIIAKLGDFGLHALVPAKNLQPRPENAPALKPIRLPKSTSRKMRLASLNREFTLSGRTGSIMYMAPEVLQFQKYNEKADVFSFAILAYEVLQKCMLLAFIQFINSRDDIERYIQYIIKGSRPHLPSKWHIEVRDLISQCWSPESHMRPSMDEVVEKLKYIQENKLMFENKEPVKEDQPGCVCCAIQ